MAAVRLYAVTRLIFFNILGNIVIFRIKFGVKFDIDRGDLPIYLVFLVDIWE